MTLDTNAVVARLYDAMNDKKVVPKVPDLKGVHFRAMIMSAKVFEFDFSNIDISNLPKELEAAEDFGKKALEYECFSTPFPTCLYVVREREQCFSIILCICDEKQTAFFSWVLDAKTDIVYMNPARGWVVGGAVLKYAPSDDDVKINHNSIDPIMVTQTAVSITSLLCCGGIEHEIISPSRQVVRAAKRQKKFVISFTRLNISRCGASYLSRTGGTKPHGVRAHWRRGHFRRLASGAVTSVRPCLVGDKSLGFVDHDYGYSFT